MTGSHLALLGAMAGPTVPGGDVTPAALAWSGIYGTDSAFNNDQTISSITTVIALKAHKSGGRGSIQYTLNGTPLAYSGSFNVAVADVLAWGIQTDYGGGNAAGTITVTNTSDNDKTLANIVYSVRDSGAGL